MASRIHKNKFLQEKIELLEQIADSPSLLQRRARALANYLKTQPADLSSVLKSWQLAQRVILTYRAGLADDAEAIAYLNKTTDKLWTNAQPLPVTNKIQDSLAQQFIDSPAPKENPVVMLLVDPAGKRVTETIIKQYLRKGTEFDVQFTEAEWMTRMMERASVAGVQTAIDYLRGNFAPGRVDKVNVINTLEDKELGDRQRKHKRKESAFKSWYTKGFRKRAGSEDAFYTLTKIPTKKDAKKDGIDYKKYIRLFFEMCDQPWKEVEKAQAWLIKRLNKAATLRITNNDGTDVTFKLVGMAMGKKYRATFANSVIAKNDPGSEVFSAPAINGVDGKIVAKGVFNYDGKEMKNITLVFKKGKVVFAQAEVGDEHLQEILSKPGAKRVGEVAFGTNPWLKKHVLNPLLVEKIGGSFHVALGASYKYTTYLGVPVQLNNGNKSDVHWDITTMLQGKDGKVYMDGKLIQVDGKFLAPQLAVLNYGWAALPAKDRPLRWKKILAAREKQERTNITISGRKRVDVSTKKKQNNLVQAR